MTSNVRTNDPTKLPGIPKAPSGATPEEKRWYDTIAQIMEIRLGLRGDPRDRAVTLRELISSGLANDLKASPFDPNQINSTNIGFVDPTLPVNATIPPAPTNFTVSGGYEIVILSWDYPYYANHAHTEIWRHTSDSIGDSQLTGIHEGRVYIDPVGEDEDNYYWARHVNEEGIPGPFHSTSGARGQTALSVDALIDQLEASIPAVAFAAGIEPVGVVNSLPTVSGYTGPKIVLLTTDGKLYRLVSGAWTAAVPTVDLTGTIAELQIADDAVTNAKIAVNAIQGDVIAASAITADKLLAGAVTELKLAAGAVSTSKIAVGAITDSVIAAGAITSAKIQAGAVGTAAFASGLKPIQVVSSLPASATEGDVAFLTTDNNIYRYTGSAWTKSISMSEVDDAGTLATLDAVSESVINAGAITATKISDGAIETAKLAAGAITAGKIAAGAVTANAITAGAITTVKLAAGAVTANEISSNAITTDKLSANAITAGKIQAGAISATELAADAVTAAKIAAGAITATEIAAGAITTEKLTANAITAAKIAAGAITATEIAAGAITANELAAGSITSDAIAAGAITAGAIAAGAINAENIIASGVIVGDKLAANTITGANIAGGTITATLLAAATITGDKIAANTLEASSLKLDNATITGNASGQIQINELEANKITSGVINATVMSGTTVYADNLTGDVNTIVPFRTTTSTFFNGPSNEVILQEVDLPATTHVTEGHKVYASAGGYISSTSGKVYYVKMYIRATPSSSYVLAGEMRVKSNTNSYVPFSVFGVLNTPTTGIARMKLTIRRYGTNGVTPDTSTAGNYVRERQGAVMGIH